MALSIATWPKTRGLTTTATLLSEGMIRSDETVLADRLILEATSGIERSCGRVFARTKWTETLKGTGRNLMRLSQRQIKSIDSVTLDGAAVTGVTIADADNGWIYLASGFSQNDLPLWSITYTAGFLLPGDDVTGTTISVAAADDSFNDAALGFPSLLVAGDWVLASGLTVTAENIRHSIAGSTTTAKVPVSSSLTNQSAGASITLSFRNLPEEIEREAIDWVRELYQSRTRVVEETDKKRQSSDLVGRARKNLYPWVLQDPAFQSAEIVRS